MSGLDRNLEHIVADRSITLRVALEIINETGRGMILLIDADRRFERTVTDGDVRRMLLNGAGMSDTLENLPRIQSITLAAGSSSRDALDAMDRHDVETLPIIDADRRIVGLLRRREISKPIALSTPHMEGAEMEFVEEAFRTNWIAPLGPNVDAFEEAVADVAGVAHAAAVSSGTAALHLALRLLNVGPGDRVFCSSFTFAASANPIVYQHAEPIFIDAEPQSWNMSPQALAYAFKTAKAEGWLPKAVIVVNLYGQSADYDPILAICDTYGVPVIEDAAESLGATYKGQASGRFGLLSVFSFNGNKIITTSGGGMLVSNDEQLITRARYLSTQARQPAAHYEHTEIGYNYRMSNILAGVGLGQMTVLDERVKQRRGVFAAYAQGLSDIDGIDWMPEPEWSYSTRWLSTLTIDSDKIGMGVAKVIQNLANELIEARPVWKPMHRQPVFAGARYFEHGNSSVSDALFASGVCLPSGSNMSEAEVERIILTLRRLLGRS
jgi:dTDP-4-amino-4,6-dideoxygalactose transaminase